jgi:hypothetical protein
MKTIIKLLFTSLIILISGCEKTDNLKSELTGTWIEIIEKSDTIAFTEFNSKPMFNLKRDLILLDDHWLPNYGSGFYTYVLLEKDSIALCYSLSSSCVSGLPNSYSKYFYKLIDNDKFIISNFYNPDISPNEILTFSKIE